jgi:hypothetical protein
MEVICIKDSTPVNDDPRIILVLKGCRYNVTNVVEEAMFDLPKNIWYELLETGKNMWHDHSIFAIAPEIKEEIVEKQLVNQ